MLPKAQSFASVTAHRIAALLLRVSQLEHENQGLRQALEEIASGAHDPVTIAARALSARPAGDEPPPLHRVSPE